MIATWGEYKQRVELVRWRMYNLQERTIQRSKKYGNSESKSMSSGENPPAASTSTAGPQLRNIAPKPSVVENVGKAPNPSIAPSVGEASNRPNYGAARDSTQPGPKT